MQRMTSSLIVIWLIILIVARRGNSDKQHAGCERKWSGTASEQSRAATQQSSPDRRGPSAADIKRSAAAGCGAQSGFPVTARAKGEHTSHIITLLFWDLYCLAMSSMDQGWIYGLGGLLVAHYCVAPPFPRVWGVWNIPQGKGGFGIIWLLKTRF